MTDFNDDPIAAIDQALRGLHDMARLMAKYMGELTEAGLERHEALALCIAWQGILLTSPSDDA